MVPPYHRGLTSPTRESAFWLLSKRGAAEMIRPQAILIVEGLRWTLAPEGVVVYQRERMHETKPVRLRDL
jgi:hypothetical protein